MAGTLFESAGVMVASITDGEAVVRPSAEEGYCRDLRRRADCMKIDPLIPSPAMLGLGQMP